MRSNSNAPLIVLASAVISALVVGGGVYSYQKNSQDKEIKKLQTQLDSMVEKLQDAKSTDSTPTPTPIVSPSVSASPTPSSSTKYSNTKYNFSFSYPKSWNIEEGSYKAADLTVNIREKAATDGTDRPADLSISVMEYVKPVESPNMFSSLEEWLKNPAQNLKNIKSITIGNRNGFSAEAGENKFGGGMYYYIPQKDKSVIEVWDFGQNSSTKNIINSLQFAK